MTSPDLAEEAGRSVLDPPFADFPDFPDFPATVLPPFADHPSVKHLPKP